eukprot:113590_1
MAKKRSASEISNDEGPRLKKSKLMGENDEEKKEDSDSNAFLLVIDTEVNDWRTEDENGNKFAGADPQSRITQLAWCVYDQGGNKIHTKSYYIKPDKWKISEKAIRYTKITPEILSTKGIPIVSALEKLTKDIDNITHNNGYIGAHKFSYDSKLILNEIKRNVNANNNKFEKLQSALNSEADGNSIIDTFDIVLLKKLNEHTWFQKKLSTSTDRVKYQLTWHKYKRFGPNLGIFHQFICGGNKSDNAHNAAIDVEMCTEIIFALKKQYNIDLFV